LQKLSPPTRRYLGLGFVVAVVLLAVPLQSALALGGGSGSISLTTLGSAYTQDFDTLANTGTANNLTINGWYLNELGTSASNNGQYNTGTGSGTGGDVYSFGATGATERAFGTLLSGTLAPTIGAQFTNNTGSTVTGLEICRVWGRATLEWRSLRGTRLIAGGPRVGDRV